MSENADTKPIPKTFYEWCQLLRKLRLKVGPYESFKEESFQHALKPGTLGKVSYGMWDHHTNTGYINWDKVEGIVPATKSPGTDNVRPAPPIPDGDKDWDL